MTFDLSKFELEDTAALTVQNAREDGDLLNDGKPVIINLYGSGSAQYQKAKHKADNAASMRAYGAMRGKTTSNPSEIAEREINEKLAACTASITNFPIDALALYSNPKLGYIRSQVIKFLDDNGNFLPVSQQNSNVTSDTLLG